MAYPFPQGVSGLFDPDEEPYIAILELCAAARRELGLPSYSRADLERFFALKDVQMPEEDSAPNVLRLLLRASRGRTQDGKDRR